MVNNGCIYCGGSLASVGRTGEHVIPKTLGCTEAMKCVCFSCNQSFSIMDNVVATRSPIRIASWHKDRRKDSRWWEVDRDLNDLLLETMPSGDLTTWTLCPQIIFVAGVPPGVERTTNVMKLHRVGEPVKLG